MRFFPTACLALLIFAGLSPLRAQNTAPVPDRPFLSGVFTDNMVLQRDQPLPFWGWTAPGRKVTVSAQGRKASGTAGADGAWRATLPALHLGAPLTVTVSGPQTATLHNVLVGDVWVCSGQSNMEFGIGNLTNADQEIAAANYPDIRLYLVPHDIAITPQTSVSAQWVPCTPDTVKQGGWNGFTAVGYFFGRELNQNLHVPIGLIESDWGGTPAESWTSERALQTMPDFTTQVAQLDQAKNGDTDYGRALAAWWKQNDPGVAQTPTWADASYDSSAWKTMALPQYWEGAGDPDLAAFDGIAWFRRTVTLPADAAGKTAVLHLGTVDDNDTTFVNGVPVGATEGYQKPRDYTVPANVLKAGDNVIAVRVLDTGGGGGIYGTPDALHLDVAGAAPLALAGNWDYKIGKPLAALAPVPQALGNNPNFPTVLYNGMIAPVQTYGIKGAIWYQGEANAGNAKQYRTLLPTMIADWHAHWGEGNFPFYIVQLAGWEPGGDAWADLRWAQWLTAQNVPNAGIATAIDIGNQADIHPKDKQDVGHRLALVALAKTYGQNMEYSGPVYQSMKVEGSAIRLTFSHLGGGLVSKSGPALTGFTIAGADGKFVPADAKIDGSTVVVSSALVPNPTAARYDWSAYPASSLYNNAGLPAFPFGTDQDQK